MQISLIHKSSFNKTVYPFSNLEKHSLKTRMEIQIDRLWHGFLKKPRKIRRYTLQNS